MSSFESVSQQPGMEPVLHIIHYRLESGRADVDILGAIGVRHFHDVLVPGNPDHYRVRYLPQPFLDDL